MKVQSYKIKRRIRKEKGYFLKNVKKLRGEKEYLNEESFIAERDT